MSLLHLRRSADAEHCALDTEHGLVADDLLDFCIQVARVVSSVGAYDLRGSGSEAVTPNLFTRPSFT